MRLTKKQKRGYIRLLRGRCEDKDDYLMRRPITSTLHNILLKKIKEGKNVGLYHAWKCKDAYVSDLRSFNFRYSLNWLEGYKSVGSNLPHKKDGTKGLVLTGNSIFWVVVKVPSKFVMTLR